MFANGISISNTIAVYANDSAIAETFKAQSTDDYAFEIVENQADGEKKLADEEVDGLLIIDASGDQLSGELLSESSLGQTAELTIQQLLSGIQSSLRADTFGLTSEEVGQLAEPATFSKQKVSFDEDGTMSFGEDHSDMQYIVSYVATIILFFFILTYAQIIAQEIASEKGTRIMEVILSSTRAQTQ